MFSRVSALNFPPYSVPVVRAVPEIILRGGGPHFFSDPSTPRTHMESEPRDPQDM